MKTLHYFISISALLLVVLGCTKKDEPSSSGKKDKLNPELSVSGAPSAAVESGTTFTLTLTSQSEGRMRVNVVMALRDFNVVTRQNRVRRDVDGYRLRRWPTPDLDLVP